MDTTNCPPGLATDQIFDAPAAACDSSMPAYWGGISAFLALKGLTVLVLLRTRSRQLRADSKQALTQQHPHQQAPGKSPSSSAGSKRQRHLSRVAVEGGFFVSLTVALLCVGYNALNFYNAGGWAIYTAAYMFYAAGRTLSVLSAVRLSRRILPAQIRDSQYAEVLDKVDTAGMFMLGFMVLCSFGTQVALVIVAPIVVRYEVALAQAGLVFKGLFGVTFQSVQMWQLMRCMSVIRKHDRLLREGTVPLQDEARLRARQQMQAATSKLRKGIIINVVFLPGSLYFFLLASRAVPWRWWVVTLNIALDCLSGFVDALYAGGRQSVAATVGARLAAPRAAHGALSGTWASSRAAAPHSLPPNHNDVRPASALASGAPPSDAADPGPEAGAGAAASAAASAAAPGTGGGAVAVKL